MKDTWKTLKMNQPDQKVSVESNSATEVDAQKEPSKLTASKFAAKIVDTPTKKESLYQRLIAKMRKSLDADLYYTEQVKEALGERYDQKKEGMFKRLSTCLFQYTHYTANIKKDIESQNNSLNLYLVIYAFGLVLVPFWLTYLEFTRVLDGGNFILSLLFLVGYVGIMGYGFYRILHTLSKKKNLQYSLVNLYIHGLSVINASKDYNIRLLKDKDYGATHGFDDEIRQVLDLESLLHNEYDTVKKIYERHYLDNVNFDYMNLPGMIRAHQALYNSLIKGDLNNLKKEQADQVLDDYETAIKKLHEIHINRFNQLIKPPVQKSKLTHQEVTVSS